MEWLSDLIDPITNTVDDIWYTNEEQAANDTALALSNNELSMAQLNASGQPAEDNTWLVVGIVAAVIVVTAIVIYFIKRKK